MPNIIYPASFSPQASAAKLDILLAEPSDDTSSASVAAAAAAQAAVEAEEACREAEKRLAQMWMDKDSGVIGLIWIDGWFGLTTYPISGGLIKCVY